ncbi:5-methyltetrahydropteroyltriglutamate--homocysteine S-methyltransferase [Marinilongibacter aquaticus]|uniref:5-methyltetrahydropteroyltriglutamate-- homocysteine S-methyltransferase n=1 Tax=Marinilongibacter aquaticus TaxID=2975157 RepID=UPI0021BD6122|nr:5-methyltetrahydropteroyltriglutamate--homocysteine S-methyltransferase [Marinilongibacter aquaticus]UBM57464.1 5-methyltetrahydropteroyltriglutamate--homocysteine S-methyltransferase [Marinilongibacter aquaticus]
MLKNNLGYPRIGEKRELKRACEDFWAGKIDEDRLVEVGRAIRLGNWALQKDLGIDLIPSNDFSFYDQVLDHSLMFGVEPARFEALRHYSALEKYFAMARGFQKEGYDIKALELTKWFDTNYHYLVPEFGPYQTFHLAQTKVIDEFLEAKAQGINTKPVLIGPISYLLLGKVKNADYRALDLLDRLLPVYQQLLTKLSELGADYVQIDEPFLAMDIGYIEKEAYRKAFHAIRKAVPNLKIILTTYFEGLENNTLAAVNLPVDVLHIDLIRGDLDAVLDRLNENTALSLGVIDGRNIWKTNYTKALQLVQRAAQKVGFDRLMLAPSCSLLHVPIDLDGEKALHPELKEWMAFAKQKLNELAELAEIVKGNTEALEENKKVFARREASELIHNPDVKRRLSESASTNLKRKSAFLDRLDAQNRLLQLPAFPTTTIGSFPQTKAIRALRRKWKKGEVSDLEYENELKRETAELIRWQEEIGLDVLVHGEFERNDMVEYFGELLSGFAFTENGWVQSYGSRCVKPPIIFGDVERKRAMTVNWAKYAQSLTNRPVKGMLTGPITIMKWSFVRNDQAEHETRKQIALAIRDEVLDLEEAGIRIIQIDEAAYREALPLRNEKRAAYIEMATEAFCLASSGVRDETQIHTHMCYSDFNSIVSKIEQMDADVITIETSRSQMALLEAFGKHRYPNEIGPGVYDIHSPRVPSVNEMVSLLEKASEVIPKERLWVNPDCGLKTRAWPETEQALRNMVDAAKQMRN